MKTLFLSIILLLVSFAGFAQQYQVTGTVTDGDIPIANAIVRVEGAKIGTVTNGRGRFSLQLEEGEYTLVFSYGNKKRVEIKLSKIYALKCRYE